ncbi:hypothetical protein M3182_24935 [Mesobacillus maritimus]|uniref:hypothetical protein n=1 Tax=Mesobacillus maritimus TaxID=1643336 RepID=UPI00203BF5AF|nr:hypothetical protein [Mesobacillus maritimus]MCM3588874.1 hypothetical protein [Mesobacillus maritimus]
MDVSLKELNSSEAIVVVALVAAYGLLQKSHRDTPKSSGFSCFTGDVPRLLLFNSGLFLNGFLVFEGFCDFMSNYILKDLRNLMFSLDRFGCY